jgi:hypothetical protein
MQKDNNHRIIMTLIYIYMEKILRVFISGVSAFLR